LARSDSPGIDESGWVRESADDGEGRGGGVDPDADVRRDGVDLPVELVRHGLEGGELVTGPAGLVPNPVVVARAALSRTFHLAVCGRRTTPRRPSAGRSSASLKVAY
jgi:hypothetical protein